MPDRLFDPVKMDAEFSDDGIYRYSLTRTWDGSLPTMAWIMLNPSEANEERNDPTTVRCMTYAEREGCGSIEIVNLYAIRSPIPAVLRRVNDAVGPDNGRHITAMMRRRTVKRIVCGWGSNMRFGSNWPDAILNVLNAADERERALECLGVTKDGLPRHPLYLRGVEPIIPWEVPEWLWKALAKAKHERASPLNS
jgi:hypothetical protein